MLILIARVPPLEAALDRMDALVPGLLALLLGSTLPFAAMVAHMLTVQREIDRTRAVLAERPHCSPASADPRRALNLIELAAIIVVGPHILFQIYGSVVPDAFRATPWAGTSLDWSGWVGITVFAILIGLRVRAGWARALPVAEGRTPEPPQAQARLRGDAGNIRAQVFDRRRG